jgi:hypothetical protein
MEARRLGPELLVDVVDIKSAREPAAAGIPGPSLMVNNDKLVMQGV